MTEEDSNVGEETINVSDTEVEKTIDVDIENTIEVRNSENKIDSEVGYKITVVLLGGGGGQVGGSFYKPL